LSNRSLVSGGRHLLRRVGYDDECEELKARLDILIGENQKIRVLGYAVPIPGERQYITRRRFCISTEPAMKKDLWRRAEELFHAALEKTTEARRAFLDEACSEDIELHQQVEMLVAKDEQAGSFLEKPALADDMATSLAGKHYGTYHILSLLGAGGMGEVYRAHDSKLSRDVAIKTLPQEFARYPDRVARFQREAKLLASLNHPHICTIHDIDEHAGQHFIAMELIEGQTLKQRMLGR
jgi:hypothetical protein